MTLDHLLIKIKALDLLIDEVMIDITNDETIAEKDEVCDADRTASLLQDQLETIATILQLTANS